MNGLSCWCTNIKFLCPYRGNSFVLFSTGVAREARGPPVVTSRGPVGAEGISSALRQVAAKPLYSAVADLSAFTKT